MAELINGYRHIALGDVASTNAVCVEHAAKGDPGALWITAKRQLAGRGSRGRNWVSEPGNLYSSLLLKDVGAVEHLHTLTFAASLAIRDSIYQVQGAGLNTVELKWPNDVLLNRRKTSGILLESHRFNSSQYVVIGIGVNIAHFPGETLHPATALNKEGLETSPEAFIQLLSHAMDKRLAQWNKGLGFGSIRNDWLLAAANLGQMIEVKLPTKTGTQLHTGTFNGIDEQGLLLLKGAGDKLERISVADIFFA
ncbi:MAG: biotin--[acetyl-CoA-carboxylase] ligase [Salaquimonas sp.]